MSGIYQIYNPINNKRYIGSSINVERRLKEHLRNLEKNRLGYNIDPEAKYAGKHLSEETKEKIRQKALCRKISKETIEKIK